MEISQQGRVEHAHVPLQIQPSGKRFKLEEEKQKVKVEDGKIQEIVVSTGDSNRKNCAGHSQELYLIWLMMFG